MDNPAAHNEGKVPDAPDLGQVEYILTTFGETLEVFAGACKGQADLRACVARLVHRMAASGTITTVTLHAAVSRLMRCLSTASPSDNSHVTGPAAARSAGPASNDQAAATLSVAHRNTSTVAGPAAVSALRTHLPTATLSVARPSAAEKRKGRAPPGDGPKSSPLHKRQRIDPQVELIEIPSGKEGNGPSASRQASTPLFLSTMPPSVSSPIAGSVTGSVAASVTLTRLTTATPSTGRLTWTQKGKGRAPPGDAPSTPPLHMRQRVDPWAVEEVVTLSDEEGNGPNVNMRASSSARSALPNFSSSSRLGMHLPISDHDHGDNTDYDLAEENGFATVICDGSGGVITSMRVSIVFDSFFYMTLAMFATLYGRKFSCRLIPEGADPQVFHEALGALEGFKLHSISVKSTGSDQAVSLTVLLRNGPEFKRKHLDLKRRLGLTKKPISSIPVPLMCYSVVILGCMPLDQLSSTVLQDMFSTITGVDFETLPIVTSKEIHRMSYDDLCSTVTDWVHDLCRFTLKGGNMNKTLNIVRDCHKAYANKCYGNENMNADLDPKGMVAKMLKDDVCSMWLLLGIRKPEFRTLFKHLTFMIEDHDNEGVKSYMKNVSISLFKRP